MDLQCLGQRIRICHFFWQCFSHCHVLFLMQTEFRSSFFNPTSYQIVLLLSMYQTDVKQYPFLPGQLPTRQPSEEHITSKVWVPKPEVWPSTSPAPAIFTHPPPNSGNRSMCSLSHKSPASSFSLLNQDSFQAQTHILPLPLTNRIFPHFKSISFFEVMIIPSSKYLGFPGGTNGKEPSCQCRIKMRVQSLVTKILWRRGWQPTPVFLHGESHGQRSLTGYSPWR